MSNVAPFAVAGSTTSVADPRSLVLHLEVCRLQAELERLEARLGELRLEVDRRAGLGRRGRSRPRSLSPPTTCSTGWWRRSWSRVGPRSPTRRLVVTRTRRRAWTPTGRAPAPSWTRLGPTSTRRSPSGAGPCGPRGPAASTRSTSSSTRPFGRGGPARRGRARRGRAGSCRTPACRRGAGAAPDGRDRGGSDRCRLRRLDGGRAGRASRPALEHGPVAAVASDAGPTTAR